MQIVPDTFFEGTEKRIELDFVGDGDLRTAPDEAWKEVVRLSETQILHKKETAHFISYLLSESSLIVCRRKCILKTCGKTVPINSVHKVFELAKAAGLDTEWFCYSRKNFLAPFAQPWEHQSKEAEIVSCKKVCRDIGDMYVLGPVSGEHWLIYDANFLENDCSKRGDFQVDMMMYGLAPEVQQVFHTGGEPEGSAACASRMTRASGLGDLVASLGGEIDDYCFAPCGYSCNIHAGEAYAMVHVTPQDTCSYASFETNFGAAPEGQLGADVGERLNALVSRVLDIFKPDKFTISMFLDGGAAKAVGGAPFTVANSRYTKTVSTLTYFEMDYSATISNYVSSSAASRKRQRDG